MTVLQSAKRATATATALAAIRVESAIVQRGEQSSVDKSKDQDRGKGATEQNPQNQGEGGNTSMKGQLGHRDENAELKNAILICRGETCWPDFSIQNGSLRTQAARAMNEHAAAVHNNPLPMYPRDAQMWRAR